MNSLIMTCLPRFTFSRNLCGPAHHVPSHHTAFAQAIFSAWDAFLSAPPPGSGASLFILQLSIKCYFLWGAFPAPKSRPGLFVTCFFVSKHLSQLVTKHCFMWFLNHCLLLTPNSKPIGAVCLSVLGHTYPAQVPSSVPGTLQFSNNYMWKEWMNECVWVLMLFVILIHLLVRTPNFIGHHARYQEFCLDHNLI